MKKLIVFDLDGTLAPSKSDLGADMSALLHSLLAIGGPDDTKRVIETIIACLDGSQNALAGQVNE